MEKKCIFCNNVVPKEGRSASIFRDDVYCCESCFERVILPAKDYIRASIVEKLDEDLERK